MNPLTNGLVEIMPTEMQAWSARTVPPADEEGDALPPLHTPSRDQEFLRHCAWEVGEQRPGDAYAPPGNHVGLAAVTPHQGFVHWRIHNWWIEEMARQKGDAWHHCRLVARLYDVSFITFNGFNAHSLHDHTLPGICGHYFFKLPRPGTWQLAEVGFLLRNGEFLPAARSHTVPFPADSASSRGSAEGLLVTERRRIEHVGNIWDQERILRERCTPRLRSSLRLATFSFSSLASGPDGAHATFVSEMAAGQCAQGHEVHLFVPASDRCPTPRQENGIHYHPLALPASGSPLDRARAFGAAAARALEVMPPFDLFHCHEWMASLGRFAGTRPTVLSLSSIEATRRNGHPIDNLSRAITEAERAAARSAHQLLAPPWLRERAASELGVDPSRIHPFNMEGRPPDEWEGPLDVGKVKMEIGFGPLDRLFLFVGPLEHSAGVDLLVEAMPTLLHRAGNLRLALAGGGNMHGHLQHRAHQLGVGHAVRVLGHVESNFVSRLLRASEAVVLPSRCRVPFDDAVVFLARRAGKAVVTTHGGPAHLVRHEENGLVTYDNPGSMVWAFDRIIGDPGHAERMGQHGKQGDGTAPRWSEVARHYLELCASCFPELNELRD